MLLDESEEGEEISLQTEGVDTFVVNVDGEEENECWLKIQGISGE